jgi:hypothetical protein
MSVQDLRRDWRRWSRGERIGAVVLSVLLAIGTPTIVFIRGELF